MKTSLTLCIAAALFGVVYAECGACINGHCYQKHLLPGASGRAMDIDRNTNTLYVIDEYNYILTQCQLDSHVCNITSNTWNLRTLTVDQQTSNTNALINVLIGHTHLISIYKINLLNNERELLVHDGVYNLLYKDKIYYTLLADKGIFTFKDGKSRIISGTEEYYVYNFIVDKNDDIYFETILNDKLVICRLRKGVVEQTETTISEISIDGEGNAVFFDQESQAVYRVTNGQIVIIGAINDSDIYTPLFDKDNNLIYRNESDDYFHLKRVEGVDCRVPNSQAVRGFAPFISAEKENGNNLIPTTPKYNIESTTSSSRVRNTEKNYGTDATTASVVTASLP